MRYEAFFGQVRGQLDGDWAWEDTTAGYVLLDSLTLAEEVGGLARFLFEDFMHFIARRKPRSQFCVLVVDEFSSLAQSADMAARVEKARGFNTSLVLRRLKPFEVGLHYTDRHRLPQEVEEELGVTFHPNVQSLVEVCDVVTINAPLHPETENLFDAELLARMKRGAYLINTARGKICDRDAVAQACESGQLAGYAGDVWFPQPPPRDHPWRSMPHHGMTPHTSGTSLSAQARYAAGTREILECWFEGRPIRDEYLIVDGSSLAGTGAHSYSAGDATGGSDEAARFKTG
ncbi:MAG TPA: NAD(P)-dependent oxidoreductase [Solirubrobacteraceae bacterium]|nr:NAD(P)-dependent oxidoreductase [Solirubrobacteraceae bacterium]